MFLKPATNFIYSTECTCFKAHVSDTEIRTSMAINTEVFKFNSETNRRENIDNYTVSAPRTVALEKVGGMDGDFDFRRIIGDFSGGEEIYRSGSIVGSDFYVQFIHVAVQTTAEMFPENYGNIIGGLTNGVRLSVTQDSITTFTGPIIKINQDYQKFFRGNVSVPGWKLGGRSYTATFDINVPIILKSGTTDNFSLTVEDDFTSLIDHTWIISGFTTTIKEV